MTKVQGGPTDFIYVTAERMFELNKDLRDKGQNMTTLVQLKRQARIRGLCEICESNPIWRLADTGMCFTCTTGETDASDDYELIEE